jgi:hypothetical protein
MFIIWNFNTPVSLLACCIWNFAEVIKINFLGRLAPYILGLAIQCKGKKL